MKQHIHSLQALRFVAAVMVTLLHVQQGGRLQDGSPLAGGAISNIGSVGVDVFFVLSGYIICRTAAGVGAAEFLRRRVIRVVPFYWLMTLLFVPLAIATGVFDPIGGVASITFYPGFRLPWLTVGWTLCFEMLFYAVTAVVLIRPRNFLPLALGAYLLCWVLRLFFGGPFQFLGNPIIIEFLFGAALTRMTLRSPIVGVAALMTAAIGLAMIAVHGIGDANNVYGLLAGETSLARVVAMGVPAVLIVGAVVHIEIRQGWFTYLGDASYSLYLVHPHVIAIALLALPAVPAPIFTVAITLLAIAAGVAVHELIEKPLISRLRRSRTPFFWRSALVEVGGPAGTASA